VPSQGLVEKVQGKLPGGVVGLGVYIHIDESLGADCLHELKSAMRSLQHVSNVEINAAMPA